MIVKRVINSSDFKQGGGAKRRLKSALEVDPLAEAADAPPAYASADTPWVSEGLFQFVPVDPLRGEGPSAFRLVDSRAAAPQPLVGVAEGSLSPFARTQISLRAPLAALRSALGLPDHNFFIRKGVAVLLEDEARVKVASVLLFSSPVESKEFWSTARAMEAFCGRGLRGLTNVFQIGPQGAIAPSLLLQSAIHLDWSGRSPLHRAIVGSTPAAVLSLLRRFRAKGILAEVINLKGTINR
jgi:hypothetical protein